MNRFIAIIVLATFFPMQVCSAGFDGFGTDTQYEYKVPRGAESPPKQSEINLSEKNLKESPVVESSGTNWWLWGGIGLAVVIGVAALAGGGGGGGGSSPSAAGSTTVTGSW